MNITNILFILINAAVLDAELRAIIRATKDGYPNRGLEAFFFIHCVVFLFLFFTKFNLFVQ
jgi:hypothetical protein